MKTLLILLTTAISLSAIGQTKTNQFKTAASVPMGLPVGTPLIVDSNKMVVGVAPVAGQVVAPDRLETFLNSLQGWLNGALIVVTALLGWWAQNRSKVAALVPPLIKSVETHGTPALKAEIKSAAGDLGIEPAMNAAVKANTATAPEPSDKPITSQ